MKHLAFAAALCVWVLPSVHAADGGVWQSNYRAATAEARQQHTMALVWFYEPRESAANEALRRDLFSDPRVAERLASMVVVAVPLDAQLEAPVSQEDLAASGPQRLVDHPAFAELRGEAGIALIDYRRPESPHYGRVVSVYPLAARALSPEHLREMLDLPEGSLTQRTLIWAVRVHADAPQSTAEEASALLFSEAASHAQHQADIRLQGHHQWGQRFARINEQLPPDLVAQEVCAESWPGQPLVEAAEECVRCWRQSPGHWDAVRTRHPQFGFDMRRGGDVWYAVGIFGRRRQ